MSATLYHFTSEMLEELRRLYPTTRTQDLAIKFNCPINKVYQVANDMGLKKDIEWVRENARQNMNRPDHPAKQFHFAKGHRPGNTGKKQTEFMTPEAIERTVATRFKTGSLAWNHKEVGYERINVDGYVEIKVAEPNKFQLKQRYLWEQRNGTIPPGHNIQFRDGNRINFEPNNLYQISRADQLRTENSFIARYPKELQLAIQIKGALNRQINKYLHRQEVKQQKQA